MSYEQFREYEDAADKLCGECLNTDGFECDKCWVRRTLDRLRANLEEKKPLDACPRCGEKTDVEYGRVYAENGWAWHEVECKKCGFRYTLEYEFKTVDWEEA